MKEKVPDDKGRKGESLKQVRHDKSLRIAREKLRHIRRLQNNKINTSVPLG
jgi:hypothetical protein